MADPNKAETPKVVTVKRRVKHGKFRLRTKRTLDAPVQTYLPGSIIDVTLAQAENFKDALEVVEIPATAAASAPTASAAKTPATPTTP